MPPNALLGHNDILEVIGNVMLGNCLSLSQSANAGNELISSARLCKKYERRYEIVVVVVVVVTKCVTDLFSQQHHYLPAACLCI